MLHIVSVVDSISATSMPINEFVIYRSMHQYDMRQSLIVCEKETPQDIIIPSNVDTYLVGNEKNKLRICVKEIKKKAKEKGDVLIFHLHHQKSALQFFLATMCMNVRKHCLYTVHSTYSGRDTKYKISSCMCVLLSRYANCVSEAAFDEYSKFVKLMKSKRFTAIPNGVDVDRIDEELVSLQKYKMDRNTLICVGRMIPLKNQKFVVKMLKKLPQYRLILGGAEDVAGNIRMFAKTEGVEDRVEFRGLLPRGDVYRELSRAAIYVSASLVEGLPVSVLEAMRVGLIPVLSDIGPHKEVGKMCELIRILPLDEDLWVKTIQQLEEMDNTQFCEYSSKIQKMAGENFSLEKMHEKYLNIYQRI